jgi:threonine dehydrogenase-like Zn-dependent dehydrogenase
MRQLTFLAPGTLEWRDVPEPTLQGPGEAIVAPLAIATCDLDAAMLRGQAPAVGPIALGHEFIARVVSVGEGVTSFTPGQRVVVPYAISCGTCKYCQRGLTANCASVPRNAMYGLGAFGGGDWGGALSDRVRVPYAEAMLVVLPDGIEPASVASAGDNISDAWRTVGPYLAQTPGAPVLIVGGGASGSIGLYTVAIAQALGATQVDYIDRDPKRLEVARSFGAHVIEGGIPKRLGPYPITVDASAHPNGLACCLRSTEPGGVCTSVGIYYGPETPVPLFEMFLSDVTFKTSRAHSRAIIPAVLELTRTGALHPERITSETAAFEDAADSLLNFTTKLVITRDEPA